MAKKKVMQRVRKTSSSKRVAEKAPVAKVESKARSAGVDRSYNHQSHPIMALLLELIPAILLQILGIGHFYNGKIGKGIAFLLGYWVLLVLEMVFFIVIGLATLGIGLVGYIPVVIVVNLIIIIISTRIAYKDAGR